LTLPLESMPERFGEILAELGVDPAAADPARTWEAFKRLATEDTAEAPPGADMDRLLFEAGVSKRGPGGRPAFTVDFSRQWFLDSDGEYLGSQAIECSFAYPVDDDAADDRQQLWGSPGEAAGKWIEAVERTIAATALNRPALTAVVAYS
jgi:hypothetical protein